MNKEEQIKLVCDQIIRQGKINVISKFYSTDYIAHSGDKKYKGHKFIKRFTRQIRAAISDIQVIKVEFLAQASEFITWQRTLSGRHKVILLGIPPSGKQVRWSEMVVTRFVDGKITEEWVISELAGALLLKLPVTK